jgi:site-specific recombinase XerD
MDFYKQNISITVSIRPLRTKSDEYGVNGSLYFQIIVDRVVNRLMLNKFWPVKYFSKKDGKLLPRFDNDELCYQENMVINNELAALNRLKLEYYVAQKNITLDDFKTCIKNKGSRESFTSYLKTKSRQIIKDNIVSEERGKIYNTTLMRLHKYLNGKDWYFNEVSPYDIKKFESWLRNNYAFNSMVNSLSVINKFFIEAKKDGINFSNPMEGYKIPRFTSGDREALTIDELKIFKRLFLSKSLSNHQQDVLARYLFACHTGLRQSEINEFDTRIHFQNGVIKLNTIKGRRYNKKVNFRPPAFVNEIIDGRRGRIFPPMESALLNKTIKIVAKIAGIDKYLKFHSSRDTFATTYLILGGNPADLMELLAHSTINTTQIYMKMIEETKNKILDKFNEI